MKTPIPKNIDVRAIAVIFSLVVLLWLATPVTMLFLVDGTIGERGQAGDLYGSINALFSGLAFAGVIVAILLQREELALKEKNSPLRDRN